MALAALQHHQAHRLDLDPGLGDRPRCSCPGGPAACRTPRGSGPARHHQLERPLGRPDRAHAVVDAARARGAPARSRSRGPRRGACSRSGPARRGSAGACGRGGRRPGRRRSMPPTHLDARACPWARGSATAGGGARAVRAGLDHHDHDLAARVAGAGDVVLLAVDDPLVAVALGRAGDVAGVGGGHVGLGHGEGRADLAGQERASATAPSARVSPPARGPPCCRCRGPSS